MYLVHKLFVLFCAALLLCEAKEASSPKAIYNSLDPLSISQLVAFYELYPNTAEGKEALSKAWKLLAGEEFASPPIALPKLEIQPLISLITRQPFSEPVKLKTPQIEAVEKLGKRLGNRKLKGFRAKNKEEVLALPSEDIDLARGVLLEQFDGSKDAEQEIRNYEAALDLMALQVLARLAENASSAEKIKEINRFIFQEMLFRFPPHSLHAHDIDLYTFLPSVLDSRQGVCLGVSILYLSLAQRLDLSLEILTPPGHIYVRSRNGEEVINIETTARGIHVPSEMYLGINTRHLEQRSLKEVIGMAFTNQAATFWEKQDYKKAVSLYEKALPYLPNDPLMKMLLGFNYLFSGNTRKGKQLLAPLRTLTFDFAVSPETIPEDFLSGKVDIEGVKTIFLPVDETRASILKKQAALQKVLSRYPRFRAGLMQLATTYLQLGRGKEALETLLCYQKIDPCDATVNYYLAALSLERIDYPSAWKYLKATEQLTAARDHHPKALNELRQHLRQVYPEPN